MAYRPNPLIPFIKMHRNQNPRGNYGGFDLDLEIRHQVVVSLSIFALEVLHELATLADLFDQATAGAEVLLMRFQVLGEILDFRGQNGDLDLRRTGIGLMRLVLLNNALLLLCVQHSWSESVCGIRSTCPVLYGMESSKAGRFRISVAFSRGRMQRR